jgi:hypothetical protein
MDEHGFKRNSVSPLAMKESKQAGTFLCQELVLPPVGLN